MTCAERSPQQGQGVWAFKGLPVAWLAGKLVLIFLHFIFLEFPPFHGYLSGRFAMFL
jgi:hypothetical protein